MREMPAVHVLLLVLLAGCGVEAGKSAPESAGEADLVRELSNSEAATRRRAAERLGELDSTSSAVVRALLHAQRDDEDAVARAALEALDRIGPSSPLVERIEARGPFQDVGHVMVAPARVRWIEVRCEGIALREGEVLGACWRLVEIPPVFEARVKQFQPFPGAEISDPGDRIRHAWRLIGGLDEGPDLEAAAVLEDAPEQARAGEVWCLVLLAGESEWRRATSCE